MSNVQDKDHGWKRIVKELGVADGAYVAVGILSDSSTWQSGPSANLADIAAFNEFGAPGAGIPSRPFMAQSFDKNIQKIERMQESLQGDVFAGNKSEEAALESLGVFFKGAVQAVFRSGSFVKNAPATIKAKGSSSPLIDEGRLRGSIHYEVVK